MEWIPIDRENLPEGEVLAAYIHIITLTVNEIGFGTVELNRHHRVTCFDDDFVVLYPTHYFDPKTLKIPQSKP